MSQNLFGFIAKLFCLFAIFSFLGCQRSDAGKKASEGFSQRAIVVSVSSDGRHALSSHQDHRLVLWDLESRTKATISDQSNIYSAYFIKGTDTFIWQDLDDVVHVQRSTGETVKTFSHFPTYGHVMGKDLKTYFSSDQDWNIFSGFGKEMKTVKQDGNSPNFFSGKLLNLSLLEENSILLSAGDGQKESDNNPIKKSSPINPESRFSYYAGVVLWSTTTMNPIAKLAGNTSKTHASVSPDGKYVVTGSENGVGFVWQLAKPESEPQTAGNPGLGIRTAIGWDNTGGISLPPDFDGGHHGSILGHYFVDCLHYIRIYTYEPYAFFYDVNNPLPLKYFPLGQDPFPSVSDYSRNAAIDTAPEAGILVTGQRDGGGIIVYKYDSAAQTLKKVWVADRD
ncbi:hypothetical protein DESUT3_01800 [Desulfuromonas versatilis]|uniref:WD40 repeat domain-containing protein n=1 Tax=Desulfuromonas versatilis TaxID=2802975 RepID=A0ABN6DSW5_9BACT|nr:WD40 repeat domain-containing protein [Desulfuromonas versatilis]BCR03111.1 hypothetical protein DESUT3_01800 [Desulfuromonas versatilis]